MNFIKGIKRIAAVLIIVLIVQTGIPFYFRSFVQWFWAAIPLLLLSVLWLLLTDGKRWKRVLEILCSSYSILLVVFFIIVGLYSRLPMEEDPDVILIFGAEVRYDGLSPMLRNRCDKGFELSRRYPDAMVVVSGWQGPGDAMNEGEAMGSYLLDLGLSADRLRVETEASNTQENVLFSLRWIKDKKVAAVSDDFHLFRIGFISRYYGVNVTPVSSTYSSIRGLRFWFREVLAFGWNFLHMASDLLVIEAGHPVK